MKYKIATEGDSYNETRKGQKKSSKNEIKKVDQVRCIFLSQLIIKLFLWFLKAKGFYNKGRKSSTGLFCGHRREQRCAFENHFSKTILLGEEFKRKI